MLATPVPDAVRNRTAVPRDLLGAVVAFFPAAERKLTARGARF
jgi:hypothetical protein